MKSREFQTFYGSNGWKLFEGTFSFHDTELFKNFISCLLCFEKLINVNQSPSACEQKEIQKYTDKIIHECWKRNLREIHLGVVWILYFLYNGGSGSLPLFKIYTGDHSGKAVFLDDSLKVYETWDQVLDSENFPPSLLCVPHKGEYHFEAVDLHLDYVRSRSSKDFIPPDVKTGPLLKFTNSPLIKRLKSWWLLLIKQLDNFCHDKEKFLFYLEVIIKCIAISPCLTNNPIALTLLEVLMKGFPNASLTEISKKKGHSDQSGLTEKVVESSNSNSNDICKLLLSIYDSLKN